MAIMTKQEAIDRINELPDNVLEKAYNVELIKKRVVCQHDRYLEDKYRDFKIISKPVALGDIFTYFRIGNWDVAFETDD